MEHIPDYKNIISERQREAEYRATTRLIAIFILGIILLAGVQMCWDWI